ncbi:MAG TPA: hypothetical protein VKH81_03820 [Candidatus Angelobacter sp.]|nr:hypothetical protein [Candidatus Angelobacter sp.]
MRWKLLSVAAITLIVSSNLYAANPFVGKWKIDEAKSRIAGSTDSVKAVGPNTWKFQYGTFSWTVKADGTDQPTPFGSTAMRVLNATTWKFTNKNNGKQLGNETWVLSADGKSMKRTYTGQKENGEPFSATAIMKRTAGTTGFEGTWESEEVQMTFTEVDIAANGDDGVTLHIPADGTTFSLKFDGKDYPEKGPRIPDGTTVSATLAGPRKARAITKLNGKNIDTEDWEVSADGRTFTYTAQDTSGSKPVVILLHRVD